MKIGIIGATGKQGNLILDEALRRGHEVTALIRNQNKLKQNVPFIEKELYDLTPDEVEQFDVVINAFNAPARMEQLHQTSLRHITKILKDLDTRLIIVGGAGSLFLDSEKTTTVSESPKFPEEFMPTATNMAKAFEELKASKGTKWTYISPAVYFEFDGPRTGEYQLAGDVIKLNGTGKSTISYADFAIGVIDEAENAKHINERISFVSK